MSAIRIRKSAAKSLSSAHAQQTARSATRRRQGLREGHAAFFGGSGPKADEIAARQLHALRAYQGPREKKLKLTDVKRMFLEMKDQA